MVADESSAMDNHLRRQKWMEDLFKPSWAAPREPAWMKAFNSQRMAFVPKSPMENVLSNNSKSNIAGITGLSALGSALTSEASRGIVSAMGIPAMNKSIVQSVLGSPAFHNSTMWAVKSAFAGVSSTRRGTIDHLTESMPRLAPSVFNSFNRAKIETWTELGAQALEDHWNETAQDRTPVGPEDLDPQEVDGTFRQLVERVQALEEKQVEQGAQHLTISKQVTEIYQTTVHEPSTRHLTDRQWDVLLMLIAWCLGYLSNPICAPQPINDPPRIEAPAIKASSHEVTPTTGAPSSEVDAADDREA